MLALRSDFEQFTYRVQFEVPMGRASTKPIVAGEGTAKGTPVSSLYSKMVHRYPETSQGLS
jgi:hypothetical protein